MSVITGQTATILFTTMDYATGIATDADVLPTGVLYINGIASASAVTITNITTGVYRAVVTMPALSNGDYVSVCISATVNAITGKHKAFEEVADTVYLSSRSATGETLNAAGSSIIFPAGSIEYTYTVTNSVTTLPVEGVDVWISTDLAGTNIVWRGVTDAFGVVRNVLGDKPYLDPGTYYFWKQKSGFTSANPDTEVVV